MDGVTYTNDAIGNRTSDGTWTYTWEHGRQLAGMTKAGTSIAFTYGADGQRIGKSVTENNSTTRTEYYYRDGQLIEMITKEGEEEVERLHFFYNANGSPISVLYNNTRYYYVRNAQGDIVALTTVTGQKAVTYTYDAWGKPLTTTGSMAGTLGKVNPLRYRGYVYDEETGLYYLGSRYYDPGVGRFINADDVSLLGANNTFAAFNLFAYCLNNPLRYADSEGNLAGWLLGGLIGGLIGGISAAINGENFWEGAAAGAVEGAIAGGSVDLALSVVATGGATGVIAAGAIAFAGGFSGNYFGEETDSLIKTGKWKHMDGDMFQRCIIAGVTNTASMAFSAGTTYANEGTKRFNSANKWVDKYGVSTEYGLNTTRTLKAITKDFGQRAFKQALKKNAVNDVLTAFSSSHFSMYNLVWRVKE